MGLNRIFDTDEKEYFGVVRSLIDREFGEAEKQILLRQNDFKTLMTEYFSYGTTAQTRKTAAVLQMGADEAENAQDADFGRLIETAEFLIFLYDKQSVLHNTLKNASVLARMRKTPYFGRFDFKADDERDYNKFYIGRGNLIDRSTQSIRIFDWRSPVAGIYYRYGSGRAHYEAPSGLIAGDVSLKRQYIFKNGAPEFALDIDVNISDEMLVRALSGISSGKMRDIVETIQREQDAAIRDTQSDLLLIQGAAGSGKTSIALHRTAFLLYEGGRKLRSSNVLLLTPNAMFGQYISDVLPELGEQNIIYADFEDIYNHAVAHESIFSETPPETEKTNDIYDEEYYDITHGDEIRRKQLAEAERRAKMLRGSRDAMLENIVTADPHEADYLRETAAFKGSMEFGEILSRYIEFLESGADFEDITFCGRVIYPGKQIKADFADNGAKRPPTKRLARIASRARQTAASLRKELQAEFVEQLKKSGDIYTDVEHEARRMLADEIKKLTASLDILCAGDPRESYLALFRNKKLFCRLAQNIKLPAHIDRIISDTANSQLDISDAAGVLLLAISFNGIGGFEDIKQVLVDEAQDYYPLQYEVLRRLFPYCRFTVMGDFAQSLERAGDAGIYDAVEKILKKKKSLKMSFSKCYRSTKNITRFASQIIQDCGAVEFERAGEPVVPEVFSGADDLRRELEKINSLGYSRVAVITKSLARAREIHALLPEAALISSSFSAVRSDMVILPVCLSKGLEYDAVLVCDYTEMSQTPEAKRLLYVACTRAMHYLKPFDLRC